MNYFDHVRVRRALPGHAVLSKMSVPWLLWGVVIAFCLEFLLLPSSPWNFNALFEKNAAALSSDGRAVVTLTPQSPGCTFNVPRNLGSGYSSLSKARITVQSSQTEPLKVRALLLTAPGTAPQVLGEFRLAPQSGSGGVQKGELILEPSRTFIALYLVFDPAQLQAGATVTEFVLNGWPWSWSFLRLPLLLLLALGAALLYSRRRRADTGGAAQRVPVCAVLFTAVSLISLLSYLGGLFGGGWQSSGLTLFFQGGSKPFDDFSILPYAGAGLDPYMNDIKEMNYLPVSYILGYFYSAFADGFPPDYAQVIDQRPFMLAVVITLFLTVVCQALLIFHRLRGMSTALRTLCALSLLLSGLYLATLERGNTLLFSLLCSMFFCFYYQSKSRALRLLALLLLALAVNLKITPAVLGILLLYRRQWWDILVLGVMTLLILICSFLALKGGFTDNVAAAVKHIIYWSNYYMSAFLSMGVNGVLETWFSLAAVTWFKGLTTAVMLVLGFLFLVSAALFEHEWERMLAVTACTLVLSPNIFFYAVLMLMPALVLYLSEERGSTGLKVKIWYLLPLCLLFASHLQLPAAIRAYQYALGLLYLVLTVRALQCLWPQVMGLFNAGDRSPHSKAAPAEHNPSAAGA